jgi:hypothetical protein
VVVRLSVGVSHTDIHDAVSTTCPKARQKNISSVIFARRLVAGAADKASIYFFNTATRANQGFIAYC